MSIEEKPALAGAEAAAQEQKFKYEVAFSFLQQDEALAVQFNDLLQDRLATFIYPRRQEEIVGKDGEATFNRVFGEEARVVVVLYRSTWGITHFTRIEETAIRNRAFRESYDFTFLALQEIEWVILGHFRVQGACR